MFNETLKLRLFILAIGIVLFFPFLGSVHLFDWDEINFAECAREMIITGNYTDVQINFLPFWEKPPLFFWMQVISMKIFGINEFAARFPNAVCGLVTLIFIFNIGKKLYNKSFGYIWSLLYASSILPQLYFKSGIIDPWFNLFIFGGIYYFFRHLNQYVDVKEKVNYYLILSGLFIGMGILTKGPVALLIFLIVIFIAWARLGFAAFTTRWNIIKLGLTIASVGIIWFLNEIIHGRWEIIYNFILYQIRLFTTQDAGHGGPFFYHWLVLLFGCFPAVVPMIASLFFRNFENRYQREFKEWMLVLFWVVLILFSIVKTKIVHYSSLCYFPLTYLGAYTFYNILVSKAFKWKSWMSFWSLFTSLIFGLAITILPFIETFKKDIISSGMIKDKFAEENLKADVSWMGWEFLIGIFFILAVISAHVILKRKNNWAGFYTLILASGLMTNLAMTLFVPKIEKYSQNAAIEFFKSLKNEDCYIETIGYKSYAYIFYSDKKPCLNVPCHDKNWLLTGDIDKTAYFIAKINEEENLKNYYPQLKEIGRKNGFIFLKREKI